MPILCKLLPSEKKKLRSKIIRTSGLDEYEIHSVLRGMGVRSGREGLRTKLLYPALWV